MIVEWIRTCHFCQRKTPCSHKPIGIYGMMKAWICKFCEAEQRELQNGGFRRVIKDVWICLRGKN